MAHTVAVPQLCWYGNTELELAFPDSWQVATCTMPGHARAAMSRQEMAACFAHPVGTRPIRELAAGKREVAILFDDMTRPTRVADIVPLVLEELAAAGVPDEGIRFIAALGAHGAMTRIDFQKKLGDEVLERFLVYNHNPYENCTPLGETSQGTPISINSEVMRCDFKVGIGGILPHPLTGFGGGGKIVLPGIAALETIVANHSGLTMKTLAAGKNPALGMGSFAENVARIDASEAARMAGLDIKVDAIVNARSETVALFVGEPDAAQEAGVKVAREVYATEPVADNDIAVLNNYAKASEAFLAPPLATPLLKEEGGDLVLIINAPEGQVPHYLLRTFGKSMGGQLWFPRPLPQRVARVIIFSQYIDLAAVDWIAPPESVVWAKSWPQVIALLQEAHGDRARVAVVPDATMQYFPTEGQR
ncbi:MAG: lactate racemase domain-containing protein [Chloroflexota bacterium]|nr:lactate racemase domain-containing protein [Chloroflexota bacterium]